MNRTAALRCLAAAIAVLAVLALGLFHQPFYPRTWLDEGFALQGAMNLARHRTYAMKSAEGFRVLDVPLIANGPGIVVPISLAFNVFGVGLLQARLVMVVYLVGASAAFFTVGRRLFGVPAALVSVFLLLALPREGFLFLGRQTLGNVPALAYFLCGYLLWLISLENDRLVYPASAGILWGAAMMTKGQYWLVLPALALLAVADQFHLRQIGFKKVGTAFVTALGCLGIWYVAQVLIVGWEDYGEHFRAVGATASLSVFAMRPARIPGSVWYLVRSGILPVAAPGLLYAFWRCWKRDRRCAGQMLLLAFSLVWLAWYVLVSVGWHRYAFAPYAASCILTGGFVIEAIRGLRAKLPIAGHWRVGTIWRWCAALLLLVGLVATGLALSNQIRRIVASPIVSAQDFARYLDANIESGALVESWEWELDALVDLTYHHPTNDWVDRKTAVLQFGDKEPQEGYPLLSYEPDYLIDGPFSKWTGLYAQSIDAGCCTLVRTNGPYDLYELGAGETGD
ncbi:ArnT family glycosyltransferase [Chloroflexota bacterium]